MIQIEKLLVGVLCVPSLLNILLTVKMDFVIDILSVVKIAWLGSQLFFAPWDVVTILPSIQSCTWLYKPT